MNAIETAEVPLNYARMHVRDLVQQAYDAGRRSGAEAEHIARPSAEEVNGAIAAIERGAVVLAHARMEYVAKACGFEGLTEALGYLQTLRANPIADLVREAVNLCVIGDVTPSEDVAAEGGWSNWMYRAHAVVGDKPPTSGLEQLEVDAAPFMEPRPVGMRPELAADFGPSAGEWPQLAGRFMRPAPVGSVLSGLDTLTDAPEPEEAPNDEALADLEHARRAALPLYDPPRQVLSGCAVRATLQVIDEAHHTPGLDNDQTGDAVADIAEGGTTTSKH